MLDTPYALVSVLSTQLSLFEQCRYWPCFQWTGQGTLAGKGSPFSQQEVDKRLTAVAKSLNSSRSSFQAASACRRLTAVLQNAQPDLWEAPLTANGIVTLLMPYPLAPEVSLAHAATQALAVLVSTAPDATLLALVKAGAVSTVSKVATKMLDSTSLTPEDASQAIVLMLRAAVLPMMRSKVAADTVVGVQEDDLQDLAQVGQRLLRQCQAGGQRNMAHAQCLLVHLQCTHALLATAAPTAVITAQRTGLLRVALDAYMLSHDSALASAYAWELRKALAVLDVISVAFQRLEEDIMGGSDGPAYATSRRTLAVDAVVQAVTCGAASAGQSFLQGLVADVRLRDRPSIATLALRALHLLLVSCGITVVRMSAHCYLHRPLRAFCPCTHSIISEYSLQHKAVMACAVQARRCPPVMCRLRLCRLIWRLRMLWRCLHWQTYGSTWAC